MAQASRDNAYKALFSHPPLVRDLLRHFVSEAWVEAVDYASFEKVASNLVADDLRHRDSDLIWRFRLNGEWMYVYLLLEFQSRDDYWMAQRVAVYRDLLYADMRRTGVVASRGLLPRVVPIVLYTGRTPWRAALDIDELIAPLPAGMPGRGPTGSYLLIEAVRMALAARASGAGPPDNLLAVVAAIEAASEPQELVPLGKVLLALLPASLRDTLGQAFMAWVNRVVANRLGMDDNFTPFTDLREIGMLEEAVEGWAHRWERQGLEKGRIELLERQLARRFGAPLPAWVRPRLEVAGIAQLDAWAEGIFDAPTLEALLGGA